MIIYDMYSKKEKEHKNIIGKKAVALLLMAFIFSTLFCSVTLHASSAKWKKACKAYSTWLSKNNSKFKALEFDFSTKNKENYKKTDRFMIADLDKNGVPELIVTHPVAYNNNDIYVYTYKSGKVVQVKDIYGRKGQAGAISTNCQANGRYEVCKCKRNHLHVTWIGGMDGSEENIYTISKGKLKQYARANEVDISGMQDSKHFSYMVNGRQVTSKKYKAFVKKCGKSRSWFVSNTKTNRKKYLKS